MLRQTNPDIFDVFSERIPIRMNFSYLKWLLWDEFTCKFICQLLARNKEKMQKIAGLTLSKSVLWRRWPSAV